MWYKVDFYKLGMLLLPSFLRQQITLAFVKSMMCPLDNLYYKWSQFRDKNIYTLQHNGQVCYLRKALNDQFDPSLRRIFIEESNAFKRKYIYTKAEEKPRFLGKMYINQKINFADTGFDFLVFVPAQIIKTQIYELGAVIRFYKLGGKIYKIEET